ncbi:MAG: hypothetical protein WCG42_02255 [Parachlamydiaceae bacterium]
MNKKVIYDLVVLGYPKSYLPIFNELEGKDNIYLIPPFWKNQKELFHFLLRMDLAYKKQIRSRETGEYLGSNPLFEKSTISADSSICYLFFRDWYPLFASGYIRKIKELAPNTKTCWFFSDLVDTYPGIDIERMQNEFDLILSFDPEDAERYGFVYCPLSYSALPEAKIWQNQERRSNVFFMGHAKKRLDMIIAVYERLRNEGLDCDFHIVGVPLQEQRYPDEIHYGNFLPYIDYLQMALSSRCILEILQDPTHHGFTARTSEALVYGRKLLSNNIGLISAPFYDQRQINVFSGPAEINIDFITNEWQPASSPELFSPQHILKLIEERFAVKLLTT